MSTFLTWINNKVQLTSAIISGLASTSNASKLVSTGARGLIDPSLFFDFRNGTYIWDDFVGATTAGTAGWNTTTGGSGSSTSVTSTGTSNNRQGVVSLNVSASAGRQAHTGNINALYIGTSDIYIATAVMVDALGVSEDDFGCRIGLMDNIGSIGDATNGIYFHYRGSLYPNWLCKTANNSSRTEVDTGIPVLANTWYLLEIRINGTTGTVTYFIDGNLIATINTNYPVNQNVGYGYLAHKFSGNTTTVSKKLYSDFFYMNIKFSIPR